MTVRLGFAIAAHLEPEILVVDEVLAVGDAEFQKKAIGKMQDVSQKKGRTILFVSHNMGSLQSLCSSGVILENGRLIEKGTITDVINLYLAKELTLSMLHEKDLINFHKNDLLKIKSIFLTDKDRNIVNHYKMGDVIYFNIILNANVALNDFELNIRLSDSQNINIAAWRTSETLGKTIILDGINHIILTVPNIPIFPGTYYLSVSCLNYKKVLFYIDSFLRFDIIPCKIKEFIKIPQRNLNLIYTKCDWAINKLNEKSL
jgi:lipopolysaccharide transport system ATP-binding protein